MLNFTGDSTYEGQSGSLAETAYVLVRQGIESGELEPGTILKEAEVAASLNMGRTPVREGLQRLRAEGLLVHSTKGYLVLELSIRDILNVFQVRGMLEAGAARQAARAKTRLDLAHLLDALELERAAVAKDDPLLAATVAESFYTALHSASKNRFLEGTIRSVRLLTAPYFKRVIAHPGMADRCLEERVRIFNAVESGDAEEAEVASRDHIRNIMWSVLYKVQEDYPALADDTIVWPPGVLEGLKETRDDSVAPPAK